MRYCLVTGALLALFASCGTEVESELIEIRFTRLGENVTELPMRDSLPASMRSFEIEVKSQSDKKATLSARWEGKAPAGIQVRIYERKRELLPKASMNTLLQFIMPRGEGPFRGRVALFAPELPGWQKSFDVVGNIREQALNGRYLRATPPGIQLGDLEPGEERKFVVVLESFGDQDVGVSEWTTESPRVRLRDLKKAAVIVPQGQLQLQGRVQAPQIGGPWSARIGIRSDAQNISGLLTVVVSGTVVPEYAVTPPTYGPRVHYPMLAPTMNLVVTAREGRPPFTIGAVSGHERHLELVSKGTDAPAPKQAVAFKLKADAPIDVQNNQDVMVTLRLEPSGHEVRWPMKLRLLPPLHPRPDKIQFGVLERGKAVSREIVLSTVDAREFEVKGQRMERGGVATIQALARPQGMQARFLVVIPANAPAGPFRDVAIIETTDKVVPLIRIPVRGVVR